MPSSVANSSPRLAHRRRASAVMVLALGLLLAIASAPGAAAAARHVAAPVVPGAVVTGTSVTEGDSGTNPLTFVITLTARASQRITIDYTTRDGSATAASGDYVARSGRLTLEPRAQSATVEVMVRGDRTEEPDETFSLVLSHPVGVRLETAIAQGEILDDDGAPGPGAGPQLGIEDARVSEGDTGTRQASFRVALASPTDHPVSAAYATSDGSATAGEDYYAASGKVRIPAGATSAVVQVAVRGDTDDEGDEDFTVELSDAVGATLATATAHGLILDDDAPGALSIEPVGANARRGTPGQVVVLQVRVSSGGGEPVAGAPVQWSVDGEGELLDGATTATDAGGQASQRVRLTAGPGRFVVRASASADRSVDFQLAVSTGPG